MLDVLLTDEFHRGHDFTESIDNAPDVDPRWQLDTREVVRARAPDAMDGLWEAITSDEVDVGQAGLLYRDAVYYLHVTVTKAFDVPDPDTADMVVGVDINEHNVALTALDRETMHTKGTLVLDYIRTWWSFPLDC